MINTFKLKCPQTLKGKQINCSWKSSVDVDVLVKTLKLYVTKAISNLLKPKTNNKLRG